MTEPLHLHGDGCRFCGSGGRCSCNPPPWEELRRLAYTLDQMGEGSDDAHSADLRGLAEAVRGVADDLDPDARWEPRDPYLRVRFELAPGATDLERFYLQGALDEVAITGHHERGGIVTGIVYEAGSVRSER